uniref:maltotransferase domain-containing protein n=1 Tax=Pantanalinema rosaneae TaxID=1620701 RepID=UPI003D6F74F6
MGLPRAAPRRSHGARRRGLPALRPVAAEAGLWRRIVEEVRALRPDAVFVADLTGVPREDFAALAGCGFDYALSSLPWWDFRASWMLEEHEALSAVAPVMAMPEAPFGTRLAERVGDSRLVAPAAVRAIDAAVALGCGVLVPHGFEAGERRPLDARRAGAGDVPPADPVIAEALARANARIAAHPVLREPARLRALTSPQAPVCAALRTALDPRAAREATLALFNPDLAEPAAIDLASLRPAMGGVFGDFAPFDAREGEALAGLVMLAPGEARLARARRAAPVVAPEPGGAAAARAAAQAPRIVVEALSPCIDEGRHAVRRVVGEALDVTVDAYCDGHEMLVVELCWRAVDEKEWRRERMRALEPDRYGATIRPGRMGAHAFFAQAW